MQNVSPSFGVPPARKQGMSPALRSRLVLICMPLLTLALIGVGIYGVQTASQEGLDLGFPTPQVHITSSVPSSVSVGQQVTFTANSPGRDLTYTWDFNDGSHATGPNVSHTYQSVNENNQFMYTVTVTVVDAIGRKSTDSQTIKVLPLAPVANFTYTEQMDSFGNYNQTINFDASSSTIGTSGATYMWGFGDGSTDSTMNNTDQHYYYSTGTYTVTLTITDDANQTSNTMTEQVIVN